MDGPLRPSADIALAGSLSALATPALTTLWGERPPLAPGGEQEWGRDEVFARIRARAPHVALRQIRPVGRGEVEAWLPVEQSPGAEASPVGLAELCRHLTVLGACAASLLNPGEGAHYYLARRVRVERLHAGPLPRAPDALRGMARARFHPPRGASTQTLVRTSGGEPLFSLGAEYNVLREESFLGLFPGSTPGALASAPPASPAGWDLPVPLRDVALEGECLRGLLGPVTPALCQGHFERIPVLPLAAVVGGLASLAGALLRERVGDGAARYLVTRADVRAESFAHAGDTVRLDAHWQGARGPEHCFDCWAQVEGRVVAVMELRLTGLE